MQRLMVSLTPRFFFFNAALFSRDASEGLLFHKETENGKEKKNKPSLNLQTAAVLSPVFAPP